VPHGADAVVQIEDTRVVGRTALGAPVVDIKKVREVAPAADTAMAVADVSLLLDMC
jgi:hypothetical protein